MALVAAQSVNGLNGPSLTAAATPEEAIQSPDLDLIVANGSGAGITVTLTPNGPYIASAPARVFSVAAGARETLPLWNMGLGLKGNPKYGHVSITYSSITTITRAVVHRSGA